MQMRYRTVMKVNIFRLCTKDHTTALFLAVLVIVEAKMGEGSLQGKRDIRSALQCNFLVIILNKIYSIRSIWLFALSDKEAEQI